MLKAKRKPIGHRITAGADKAYDRGIMSRPGGRSMSHPDVAGKLRRSAINRRTTYAGYGLSQQRRKVT